MKSHSPKRPKVLRFEFWPYQVLYFPVFFYYLWLSFRARSLTFFTAANPGIYLGGVVGESKRSILEKIAPVYLPATVFFGAGTDPGEVTRAMRLAGIRFPCIIKPDVGERGNGVEKLENSLQLTGYLAQNNHDFIVQEFLTGAVEAGVLYYRLPDGSGSGIASLALKSFLSVTGDGASTLVQLIRSQERAQPRLAYLLHKFESRLTQVPRNGETILLEPIGNHCRGTMFLDGQSFVNDRLVAAFDAIAQSIDGFYIGRFDVKVEQTEDLWHADRIRIMELNGVTSEPAHIYDPEYPLLKAYRALFAHYRLLYRISVQNHKKGVRYAPFRELWAQLRTHFAQPG